MPQDIESYYQEAGRAGRDGEESECVLLFGRQDIITAKFLIDNGYTADADSETDAAEREKLREAAHLRLQKMIEYCTEAPCLRACILSYFGETDTAPCGKCSRCLIEYKTRDITDDARKIFGCIYRTGERFGAYKIMCILRAAQITGKYETDISRYEHLSEFGAMSGQSEREVRYLIERLIQEGYLQVSLDAYKTLSLTKKVEELSSADRILLPMKDDYKTTPAEKAKARAKKKAALTPAANLDEIPGLFNHLKTLRRDIAAKLGIPAFVVFTDSTLRDMSVKAPVTLDQFRAVSGVGDAKTEKYAAQFIAAIQAYIHQQGK